LEHPLARHVLASQHILKERDNVLMRFRAAEGYQQHGVIAACARMDRSTHPLRSMTASARSCQIRRAARTPSKNRRLEGVLLSVAIVNGVDDFEPRGGLELLLILDAHLAEPIP
jgi:hypothetical protein